MSSATSKPSYSAAELASFSAPGWPTSERRMRARLDRENCPWCEVKCQGGKTGKRREFYYAGLPQDLRLAIPLDDKPGDQAAGQDVVPLQHKAASPFYSLAERTVSTDVAERAGHSFEECLIADARFALLGWIARMMKCHAFTPFKVVSEYEAGHVALPSALDLCASIANDRNGFDWKVDVNTLGLAVPTPRPGQDLKEFARLPSWGTVKRWAERFMHLGWKGLIPVHPKCDMLPPVWSGEFLKIMQRPQKPTIRGAFDQMRRALPDGMRVPSYRTVLRWYTEKYSNLDKQRGRNVGSAMNPHKFAHARTSEGMLPGDEVHSDGWSTHFLAPHPVSGKFVKLEVWHSHDVATRYVYPPSVGLSESATVILGSIASVIAMDGVPAIWQTDNTGSVKNDRIEFDPVSSIAARAGMTIVHNIAGNSQANGIAEEFGHYLDARAKELATYQGDDMDALTGKRVLRITQKMVAAATREEALLLKAEAERVGKGIVFESYAQAVDWLRGICAEYDDRPHRALPKTVTPEGRRHMSPAEMRAAFIEQGLWRPAPMSVENLADLLHVHERKKVVRGCVSVFGQRYHHRDLDHINGEEVLVAYDINDGLRVWVKHLDGVVICEAAFYESRRYRPMSFMELALEKRADMQQRRLQQHINDIEAQRPGTLIDEQARIERREAAALEAPASSLPPNVVQFQPAAQLPVATPSPQKALAPAASPRANGGIPIFGDNLEMLYWFAEHREAIDDYYWNLLTEFAEQSPTLGREFERLFLAKEGAG